MEIKELSPFTKWFKNIKDFPTKKKIWDFILRVASGNFTNVESVGSGIQEIKIHYKKGYRVYFITRGNFLIILLLGGDKGSQQNDIKKAKELKEYFKEIIQE
ncbi:MAG: type II toxin-antitoxin system RelE/ParE family toxin [Endomicrobium sp.]|jgi:putative addiction module killer protein|nr:type II toxin-antitoxin system RelE/ParE family toxin [Endomicrobium sp.]